MRTRRIARQLKTRGMDNCQENQCTAIIVMSFTLMVTLQRSECRDRGCLSAIMNRNLGFLVSFLVSMGIGPSHLCAQQLLFNFATPEPILSSPALAPNGFAYLASYDRNVYALSPEGNKIWSVELPPPIYIYFATYTAVYGTPAIGSDGTF